MIRNFVLSILFAVTPVFGQPPTLEQRLAELERRVKALEEQNRQATSPSASEKARTLDAATIYEARSEKEAMVAAWRFVEGIWSSTGYETSGRGNKWMKWEFFPNGTMLWHSAYSAERRWESTEREWKIATGRLKTIGELVYLIAFDPTPNGVVVIQRDGTIQWSTGEFECVFKRGDQFSAVGTSPVDK